MRKPSHVRDAYNIALQFDHLVSLILDAVTPTHPREGDELAEYTNQMLRCLRRSNNCVGTRKGREQSVQAAVWLVEVLITLNDLQSSSAGCAEITAAIEVMERIENALRDEGSLPPARD